MQLAGLAALATLLSTLTKRQALIHGVPLGSAPDTRLPLVIEEKLGAQGTPPSAIARTLDSFAYTSPHLLMFDVDPDPYERYSIANATALMAKLASIWPVCAEIGYLATVSTLRLRSTTPRPARSSLPHAACMSISSPTAMWSAFGPSHG